MLSYRSLFAMGTRLEMVFPDIDEDLADHLVSQVRVQLADDEYKLSLYNPESVFSQLNRNAFRAPFTLDAELFTLFTHLIRWSDLTDNYFDFTLGHLKLLEQGEFSEKIEAMLAFPVRERFVLDEINNTILFNFQEVTVDSGAFGKGYALDRLKKILFSNKIKNAFISFGDSSVLTLGAHPMGDVWKVGIADLTNPGYNAWVFSMNDGAVSSSGNRVENLARNPRGHIFNPHTRTFNDRHALVSVSGSSSVLAEVLSTALFIADPLERPGILSRFPGYEAVELFTSDDGERTHVQSI